MQIRLLSLILLLVLSLILACGEDGSVNPAAVHYNVYVAALAWPNGIATDPLFIIDAESLVVIDSIPRVGSLHDMEVSPDGRWMYAFVHRGSVDGCPNDSLRRIDLGTKKVDWALPSGAGTHISLLDNGNVILRRWSRFADCAGGADLLDASTGQITRQLSDSLHYQEGPLKGSEVAAIVGDNIGAAIIAVDVQTARTRGEIIPKLPSGEMLAPTFARLHPDGETVLVVAGLLQELAWAMIGNLTTGEWLLQRRIYDISSVGTFSADGRRAVVSDMNSGLSVFDLDSMTYRGRIAVAGGQVEFVGDSKSVISCGPGDYFHATDPIVRTDIESLQQTNAIELPLPNPLLGAMTVGRKPE